MSYIMDIVTRTETSEGSPQMSHRYPTVDETRALLRAPWRRAEVTKPIYAFGDRLEAGDIVKAKPYHNDPLGYVSILFRDSNGELHEFTEAGDRIRYVDPVELTDRERRYRIESLEVRYGTDAVRSWATGSIVDCLVCGETLVEGDDCSAKHFGELEGERAGFVLEVIS